MTAFAGHDAFREELKIKYMSDVQILVSAIKGMTTDRALDLLIKSIEKTKGGAEPQDSPTWRVAKFIHDGGLNNIKEKRGLSQKIAKKTRIQDGLVRSILSRYDWDIPAHLSSGKTYPQREIFDKPSIPVKEPEKPRVFQVEKGGVEEIIIKTSNVEITLKMRQ